MYARAELATLLQDVYANKPVAFVNMDGEGDQRQTSKSLYKMYTCRKCDIAYPSAHFLYHHQASAHGFSCQYCSLTFPNKSRLYQHCASVHNIIGTGITACHFCLEMYPNTRLRKHHEYSKHLHQSETIPTQSRRRFFCPLCSKSFSERGGRENHWRRCHQSIEGVEHTPIEDLKPTVTTVLKQDPKDQVVTDCKSETSNPPLFSYTERVF